MELTVLLFGPAAAALGGRESVRVPMSGVTTVAELGKVMKKEFPLLAPMVATGRFAVNHAFAEAHDRLEPSDEIALIAMVSGG